MSQAPAGPERNESMGFDLQTSVSALAVFVQGLLSFFSPCVLPLVPLYLGYLAGGAREAGEEETRRRTLVNTFFFVVGISFAFFLLGLGVTSLGQFFSSYRSTFTLAGGILILLMGLWQLFGKGFSRELRLPFRLDRWAMGPVPALIMGFTFSFAWTPCVGPALTSVLVMAGSSQSQAQGFILIGIYTLGFVIPFLGVALFTQRILSFFRSHSRWLEYTAKAGGVVLILMGLLMLSGRMTGLSSTLAGLGDTGTTPSQSQEDTAQEEDASQEESLTPPAPDFTLTDQFGNTHSLADYEGKTILLNFWATWCGPCKKEMPDLQALYEDWDENAGDLVVLGVAAPKGPDSLYPADDKTAQEIADFLEENGYDYPVLMDTTGELFMAYGVNSFPTTFMIDKEGNVFGYLTGTMSREIMDDIVNQTMTGQRTAG